MGLCFSSAQSVRTLLAMIRCSACARDLVVLLGALLGLAAGCERPPAEAPERTPPQPNAPAAYGPPTGIVPAAPARAQAPPSVSTTWSNAGLAVLQTELSPAVLVHAASRHLDLFAGTTNAGLGAPAFITWTTMNGPRTCKRDAPLELEKTGLEECWLLVWWAGAEGWTNWDVPWVVYLQHKPQRMALDADGLHLDFARAAGDVVLLPLYGYEKLPQRGRDFLAEHGMTGRKVKTWDWPEVLKRDPLARIRYWAAVTRELPVHCEESFQVNAGADAVTFRSRFTWHRIEDEWKTPHLRLAPVSPVLALAVKQGFPAQFSKRWFDLDYFTAYGPLLAVEGVDQFEMTMPVLQYVNETERISPPAGSANGAAREAAEVLNKLMTGGVTLLPGEAAHSLSNLWALNQMTRALAYCSPSVRSNASSALAGYWRETALATNYFVGLGGSEQRGPREHVPRLYAANATSDRGRIANALLLQALWAYAQISGDWGLCRERWPLVSSLDRRTTVSWKSPVADGISANGDWAGACIAMARLAYRVGDMKLYHGACAQLAVELAALVVKQRGGDFFRTHQPYHSMEFIDDEVFPVGLQAGLGWKLDGPQYPAALSAEERWFARRWDRFSDLDVARFCREYLLPDIRRELGWLRHGVNGAQDAVPGDEQPSFLFLRSLLLQEDLSALTASGTRAEHGSAARRLADCMAVLRAGRPVEFQRLIPPFTSPGWLPGPEPAGQNDRVPEGPVCSVIEDAGGGWPGLGWRSWNSPNGQSWIFGAIRPAHRNATAKPRVVQIGSNTSVMIYESGF